MSVTSFTVVPLASLPFPPLVFTISLFFVCSRAWVAVRKSRTICSWQVAHSSDPTNSAPGMLGGARIVRLVVLQESKISASATAPPAPHKNVSRLPRIHRVNLEPHTNREYAQKQKTVTTHFFRFFLGGLSKFYREVRSRAADSTKLRRRFARQSSENAIELRERLKPSCERDLTDAQI